MKGGLTIHRLMCERCGEDLPVMGDIVTFRCGVCGACWIAPGNGLDRLAVYRAAIPGDGECDDPVYLPFWVVAVDTAKLESSLEEKIGSLSSPGRFSEHALNETGRIIGEIASGTDYNVYVPCFPSADPMSRLKAGRLMTGARPSFHAGRTDSPGRSPACTMLPEEALTVADYIFYSTLPGHVRRCPGIVENIRLVNRSAPVLIEFPFVRGGGSMHSLIGDFHLPERLVDMTRI